MTLRKVFKQLRKIKLDNSRKLEIKANLIEVMNLDGREAQVRTVSWFYVMNFRYLPIALLLIVMLGGGTAFAAEEALPGETLYPVKTEVNERVRGFIARSDNSKAKLHARLIEERLEELERLISEGKFNEEMKEYLEYCINMRALMLEEKINLMATTTAYILQNKLINNLAVHEDVLKSLEEEIKEGDLSSIVSRIQLMRTQFYPKHLMPENRPAAQMMEEIKASLEGMKEDFQNERLRQAALDLIQEQIQESQKFLREGSILNGQGHSTSAKEILYRAEKGIERVQKMREIHKKLKFETEAD